MFILPAGTLTIVGTTETEYDGAPDAAHATADDVTYLLRSANAYFPAAHLVGADVVSAWAGVRPLIAGNGDPGRASREHVITWTAHGLLTVRGGKLTTYRAMASDHGPVALTTTPAVTRSAKPLSVSTATAPRTSPPSVSSSRTSRWLAMTAPASAAARAFASVRRASSVAAS